MSIWNIAWATAALVGALIIAGAWMAVKFDPVSTRIVVSLFFFVAGIVFGSNVTILIYQFHEDRND